MSLAETILRRNWLEKKAFVPTPGQTPPPGGMGGGGMDPSMGGMPMPGGAPPGMPPGAGMPPPMPGGQGGMPDPNSMDPAMMQAMMQGGMDPSMMMGPPPEGGDPAAAGMDPAMMGPPPEGDPAAGGGELPPPPEEPAKPDPAIPVSAVIEIISAITGKAKPIHEPKQPKPEKKPELSQPIVPMGGIPTP